MRHLPHQSSLPGLLVLLLVACNGSSESASSDGGAPDATTPDATSPDAASTDATTPTDAGDDALGAVDASDAGPTYAGPTVQVSGKTVESPSATPLPGVTVCVLSQPALPCVQSSSTGAFALAVPASSDTGLLLTNANTDSILVPITTTTSNQPGWEIGLPASGTVQTTFTGDGLSYPSTTAGFLEIYLGNGTSEIDAPGLTAAIAPQSGIGPKYLSSTGTADPSATATSSYSAAIFGGITPGDVTVSVAPASSATTATCSRTFGGWSSTQQSAARAPIVAGFTTHLGMACAIVTADAGPDASADGGDAGDAGDAATD
jgi:hypothetical protein